MTNPYGITLDSEWIEWATKEKASETVAAAVLLICETRPVHEVVAKLTPGEFERVVDIVRRSPDHFPPGTLAALESHSPLPAARPQSYSVSTDQAPRQGPIGTKPDGDRERGNIGTDRHARRPIINAEKSGTVPGTSPGTLAETVRRRVVVDDLMKLGLSVRAIAAGSGIPRSSVHRAMQAVARAEAKKEVAIAELTTKLLGKKLSRRQGRA